MAAPVAPIACTRLGRRVENNITYIHQIETLSVIEVIPERFLLRSFKGYLNVEYVADVSHISCQKIKELDP
jgi:hypothetical protein